MSEIGIVAVAVGIEPEITARFESALSISVRTDTPYQLRIMNSEDYVEDGLLNKSRALNDGVRELMKLCDIIVCTDIDMLIPPSLVDYSLASVKPRTCLWVVSRNVAEANIYPRAWEEWMMLPLRLSGFGSWNAMLKEDWMNSGGWDQRLTGWGGEDDVFKKRREQRGIHTEVVTRFPLIHVGHGPRQNKADIHGGNQVAVAKGLSGPERNWLEDRPSS